MPKKVFYRIFPEEKIIIEYFGGKVKWSDLVEMKKKEVSESGYNPNYNIITDIRDAILNLDNVDEVNSYLDYLRSNQNSVGIRKTAILTNNLSST